MVVKITLREFAKECGQQNAADQLGISQYAISKAVNSNRKIFIYKQDNKISAIEERPFPARIKKGKSA